MKLLFILLLVLLLHSGSSLLFGQNYQTAAGVMWGGQFNSGVTLKRFLEWPPQEKNNDAIEIIFVSFLKGGLLYGLYQRHNIIYLSKGGKEIAETDAFQLTWLYGLGLHAGNFRAIAPYCDVDKFSRFTKIGVDAVIGLEYEVDNAFPFHVVPVTVGFDVKPFYDIIGKGCGGYWAYSLSIRYVFGLIEF